MHFSDLFIYLFFKLFVKINQNESEIETKYKLLAKTKLKVITTTDLNWVKKNMLKSKGNK